ncbi:DUF1295 domain-containing protein [Maribacter sp. 2308TA10-17]|uniref:DUF1295 domain-containing protein n=1 Tax=Maribacter sp. 2308TA10-17 TaxID=3386276 RepID=UPI0039BCF4FA
MNTRTNHLLQIVIIYIIIALGGLITWKYIPIDSQIFVFMAADFVMTVICFIYSVIKRNSSVYDAFWSVIPFYFVLLLCYINFENLNLFHYLTLMTVSIWSWRLTLNWARSWAGFSQEDWRYVDLAEQTGKFYPFVNFFGIHLFPTAMVFAGMWPLFSLFSSDMQISWLFFIGMFISLSGTTLEYIADNQLAKFRKRVNPKPEDLLDTGIWGKSRNPNYLGEILFWFGIFLMGYAFDTEIISIVGSIVMLCLFVVISIPLKEDRMIIRKSGYREYRKRVPKLIPKFW